LKGCALLEDELIDTGAFSICISSSVYEETGGKLEEDEQGALDVQGRDFSIDGKGNISLMLCGKLFQDYPVRVMEELPSRIPIGRKLWIENKLKVDMENFTGTITSGGVLYEGELGVRSCREAKMSERLLRTLMLIM